MSELFEYRDTSHFTAGAIGEPGARTFYIQAGDEFGYHSVKLEKQQVAALADFLRTVLEDLPAPSTKPIAPVPLIEPAQPAFVVGQIAVGVDEAEGRVVLVVEELVVGIVVRVTLTVAVVSGEVQESVAERDVPAHANRVVCRREARQLRTDQNIVFWLASKSQYERRSVILPSSFTS